MSKIFIGRGGDQLGEFTEEEVKAKLSSGEFLSTDLWWREGMEEWLPLSLFSVRSFVPEPQSGDAQSLYSTEPVPSGMAWENSALGWWQRWWETTSGCLFTPVKTFREMRPDAGFGGPLGYYMLTGMVVVVLSFGMQILMTLGMSAMGASEAGGLGSGMELLCMIPVVVVIGIIAYVVNAFVGGGILHLLLMVFGAADRGYQATVRAFCYTSGATMPLGVVPCIGVFVSTIWWFVAATISLKEVHQTEYWKVICAMILGVVLCCGSIFAIFFAVLSPILASEGISWEQLMQMDWSGLEQ